MKDSTINVKASELANDGKIMVRYRELLKEYSNMNLWTREAAFNEYEWLKNRAKEDIQEEGVRQATANAFLDSLEGMNQMAFRDLELRSEERRVGKECRARWATEHDKKKWKTKID